MKTNFFVYRFINYEDEIVYVGRTVNLQQRFAQHEHLTDDIKRIEYINCHTEADMAWKEIYYINFFYNKKSTNVSDVYGDGNVTNLKLNDRWLLYKDFEPKSDEIFIPDDFDIDELRELCGLIHIFDNEKLNSIGKDRYALSYEWFKSPKYIDRILQLKNNMTNYFRNIVPKLSNNPNCKIMWTTFSESKHLIKGKGYTKAYIDTAKSPQMTNATCLAYAKNFFVKHDGTIDEDSLALTDLLQLIWRSAIRDKKEIWIYIPSVRMRNLLKQWIFENSIKNENQQRSNTCNNQSVT